LGVLPTGDSAPLLQARLQVSGTIMPMGLRFRVVTPRVRLEVNGVACSRSCPRALLEANVRDERKCLSNMHDYRFKLVIRRTARRCSVRSKHPDIILAFSFLARMKRKHSDINRLQAKVAIRFPARSGRSAG